MSNENNPSASGSGTTSTIGRESRPEQPKSQNAAANDDENVSEADYITREQDAAKAAIAGVIGDFKQALAQGADVKQWTRLHPWAMVGGAAVAGLAAGLLLVPSSKSSRKRKDPVYEFFGEHWDEIRDKLNQLSPQGAAAAAAAATAATSTAAAQQQAVAAAAANGEVKRPSILGNLFTEVMKIVGPTLGGLITGALAGSQQQEPPSDGNGHASAEGYRTTEPPPTV